MQLYAASVKSRPCFIFEAEQRPASETHCGCSGGITTTLSRIAAVEPARYLYEKQRVAVKL